MKNFLVRISYETIIEAEDEDEAIQKFWEVVESEPQQNLASFIDDNLKVKEATADEIEKYGD